MTDDLKLLIDAAEAAGKIASGFFHGAAERWDKPGGQGPVTEADLAVDRMLRNELTDARPDYGWLSEETEDSPARLDAEQVFIVDPIDGTRSFIEGSTTWAHSLAIARNGIVEAAVVYLRAWQAVCRRAWARRDVEWRRAECQSKDPGSKAPRFWPQSPIWTPVSGGIETFLRSSACSAALWPIAYLWWARGALTR